ncbi:MAG: DUF2971 domain-containing protein [Parashewanella sp.]
MDDIAEIVDTVDVAAIDSPQQQIAKPQQDRAALDGGDALYNQALRYHYGEGVEQSFEKAAEYCQQAARLDHSRAICHLALMYQRGDGVEQSFKKAVEYYQQATKLGNNQAMFSLALCYQRGKGVEPSSENAIAYYQQAANLGHIKAMYNLAIMYESDECIEQSFEKAVIYYQQAAELGDIDSMFNLALCYRHGEGVKQSFEKAVEYYKQAAQLNDSDAMFNLAVCYQEGEGVKQSFYKAVAYYRKAADLGHSKAMFNLALRYQRGQDVKQSFDKAVAYYRKAAVLDDSYAKFNLALLIRQGKGCEQNQEQAETMFQQLYDHGDHNALRYMPHPSLSQYVYPALIDDKSVNKAQVEKIKRAFASFQDEIIDIMESCEYTDSDAVYHFTRWPAIDSMLPKQESKNERNVIRLYHEDYMNDPNEGMSLHALLEDDQFEPQHKGVAQFMAEVLGLRTELTLSSSTYMASFTKSSDRLDLWRAYGNDGDGFCLKININQAGKHIWSQSKFDTEAKTEEKRQQAHSYKLYNVSYQGDDKKEKLAILLSALTPLYRLTNEFADKIQTEIKKTIFYMLGEVVYLFKDEQYSSEKEVRMFQRLSLDEVFIDESEIGKLYKPTGPILFTDIGAEIMIGPKVHNPRAVELSLRKRLQINGFRNTKVTHSQVKYR